MSGCLTSKSNNESSELNSSTSPVLSIISQENSSSINNVSSTIIYSSEKSESSSSTTQLSGPIKNSSQSDNATVSSQIVSVSSSSANEESQAEMSSSIIPLSQQLESSIALVLSSSSSLAMVSSNSSSVVVISSSMAISSSISISSSVSSSSSIEMSSSVIQSGVFTDGRDGQLYNWQTIGIQIWMAENLNYDTLDGTNTWCPNNKPTDCEIYGRLYDWTTTMSIDSMYNTIRYPGSRTGVAGICPDGWHLPSYSDWEQLATFVAGDSLTDKNYHTWYQIGPKLKAEHTWHIYKKGTNEFGFSGLGAGKRSYDGDFDWFNSVGFWWTSRDFDTHNADRMFLMGSNDEFSEYHSSKTDGLSVRCLKGI